MSIVIAIAGPPGAGKTTLARAVAALRSGCRHIAYDDFPNPTQRSLADVKAWFERGGDPNEFELAALEASLAGLKGGMSAGAGPVLFETPLGRTHHATGRFIDKLVWIDLQLDMALARQVGALCAQSRRGAAPGPGFVPWLEQYLAGYRDIMGAMYRRQAIDVRRDADLILDGLKPPADLAHAVLAVVP